MAEEPIVSPIQIQPPFAPEYVVFRIGYQQGRWHRFKQLIHWVWTGEATFKYGDF